MTTPERSPVARILKELQAEGMACPSSVEGMVLVNAEYLQRLVDFKRDAILDVAKTVANAVDEMPIIEEEDPLLSKPYTPERSALEPTKETEPHETDR